MGRFSELHAAMRHAPEPEQGDELPTLAEVVAAKHDRRVRRSLRVIAATSAPDPTPDTTTEVPF